MQLHHRDGDFGNQLQMGEEKEIHGAPSLRAEAQACGHAQACTTRAERT